MYLILVQMCLVELRPKAHRGIRLYSDNLGSCYITNVHFPHFHSNTFSGRVERGVATVYSMRKSMFCDIKACKPILVDFQNKIMNLN